MKTGLVIGKFYPPHHGHRYLLEEARKKVDRLYVLVCAHRDQEIPGVTRLQWLHELHPDCEIRLVDDTLPEEHSAWATFVRAYFGFTPDVVFTSEDYGTPFAEALGAEHVMVDRIRARVPVSGTKVRAHPIDWWDFIDPPVRSWYIPRVVLIGAESTGKSTLAAHLARTFGTTWVQEFAREYCEVNMKFAGQQSVGDSTGWSPEEFDIIATIQQANENRFAREANRLLICDTNAFVTGTWYERYYGKRSPTVDAIGRNDKVDLYLLCQPDIPFEQDGTRDGERARAWMHDRFVEQLKESNVHFEEISGDWARRNEEAVLAVQRLLAGKMEQNRLVPH